MMMMMMMTTTMIMMTMTLKFLGNAEGAWDAEEAILEQRIARRLLTQEDRLEQKLGSVITALANRHGRSKSIENKYRKP
eukprot:10979429-Karenia_brevis.AAC.1